MRTDYYIAAFIRTSDHSSGVGKAIAILRNAVSHSCTEDAMPGCKSEEIRHQLNLLERENTLLHQQKTHLPIPYNPAHFTSAANLVTPLEFQLVGCSSRSRLKILLSAETPAKENENEKNAQAKAQPEAPIVEQMVGLSGITDISLVKIRQDLQAITPLKTYSSVPAAAILPSYYLLPGTNNFSPSKGAFF